MNVVAWWRSHRQAPTWYPFHATHCQSVSLLNILLNARIVRFFMTCYGRQSYPQDALWFSRLYKNSYTRKINDLSFQKSFVQLVNTSKPQTEVTQITSLQDTPSKSGFLGSSGVIPSEAWSSWQDNSTWAGCGRWAFFRHWLSHN